MTEVERMRRYIKSKGVVFGDGSRLPELVDCVSADPIPALIERARDQGLKLIYVYDMQAQDESRREQDATIWKNVTLDGRGTWYAIGISYQALSVGRDYAVLVFLHELAHLFTDCIEDHTAAFHAYLDELLTEYNRANGTAIKNDYFGLSDQKPQKAPERAQERSDPIHM